MTVKNMKRASFVLQSNSFEGRPIGALSITTTTARHSFDDLNEWKQPLTQAVEQIAQAAKDWQFPTL